MVRIYWKKVRRVESNSYSSNTRIRAHKTHTLPHTWAFAWVYICAYARVHVCTAVYTCNAHTTHTYTHTQHTHHTIMGFPHDCSSTKSLSGWNIRMTRRNQHLWVRSPFLLLCLVLLCTFVYLRMYVSVCSLWSGLFPFSELVCDLLPRRLLSWLGQRRIARRVSQGHNIDEHCLGGH